MAFNTNNLPAEYVASAGQTVFPFTFKIYKNTDILGYKTPNGQSADDVNDLLTLSTQYTVTIEGDTGGFVTLLSPTTNGDRITLLRVLPIIRDVEFQTNGDMLASTLNQDQNYQTYVLGDLDRKLQKALRLPDSSQGLDAQLPSPSPSNYIRWNTNGTALENDSVPPPYSTLAEAAVASATTATNQATIATTKASEASASATSASNSATTATTKANEASASATSANNSAISASNSANAATTKANEASSSASNALASETQAGIYRNEAEAFSISNVFIVKTIEDLVTIPSNYTTAIVKDLDRGGTFIWSATGTANGGTVFAGATGYWNRQYSGAVDVKWFGIPLQNSPFGRTGLRLAVGEKRDAHYAWGSIVEMPGTKKWVMVYRKGTMHGTEDGAECRAVDSYDFGVSWVNDRLVHSELTTDSRSDVVKLMANGRIGFFLNRASSVGTNKYPLFISSDDEGITWNKQEVPTASISYTFASIDGLIDFPASQGGNDTTGFVAFGYINALGIDAFTTVDNGDTWSIVSNVNGDTVVSETTIVRIGDTDRWLMYVRATPNLLVYSTTNILNWGTPLDTGLENLSTPPASHYDATTNKVYYFGTARAGREVDGYANNILYVEQDAETLWNAQGVFNGEYKNLVTAPNWATGYLHTFNSSIGTCATFTAGENVANGLPPSSVWLIGNFETSGADIGNFVDKYTRNMREVNFLEMRAVDNSTTAYPFIIYNKEKTANIKIGPYRTYVNVNGGEYVNTYNNGNVLNAYNGNVIFDGAGDFILKFSGKKKFEGLNYFYGAIEAKIGDEDAVNHFQITSATAPSIRSQSVGTTSSRKHIVFHHGGTLPTPEVGSISTTLTATAYNTSSDENLKDFIGEYSYEKATSIIKADPVREFTWKATGEKAVGWGAQTSYSVSKDLATKGGWFLDDVEVEEGTEGAIYIQWGVDQSKRTPYLWAAVSGLIKLVENLQNRITILENKYEN